MCRMHLDKSSHPIRESSKFPSIIVVHPTCTKVTIPVMPWQSPRELQLRMASQELQYSRHLATINLFLVRALIYHRLRMQAKGLPLLNVLLRLTNILLRSQKTRFPLPWREGEVHNSQGFARAASKFMRRSCLLRCSVIRVSYQDFDGHWR